MSAEKVNVGFENFHNTRKRDLKQQLEDYKASINAEDDLNIAIYAL